MFKKYSIIVVLLFAVMVSTAGCGEDLVSGIARETGKFASWVDEKLAQQVTESDAEYAQRKAKWLAYYNHKLDADKDFEMQMKQLQFDEKDGL